MNESPYRIPHGLLFQGILHFLFQRRGPWVNLTGILISNFPVRLDCLERLRNSIVLEGMSVDRGVKRRGASLQGDERGASVGKVEG